MNLYLHDDQLHVLVHKLAQARRREIGGVLVGERLSENNFRVMDLSFQLSSGTETCFVRKPEEHERFFADFFERTERNFERFNYLGEWHSHPSFPASASQVDREQMQAIVEEGSNAALFAVLLVVRLIAKNEIELSATAFKPGCAPTPVAIHRSPRPPDDPTPVQRAWWQRILAPVPKDVRMRNIAVNASGSRDYGSSPHEGHHGGES